MLGCALEDTPDLPEPYEVVAFGIADRTGQVRAPHDVPLRPLFEVTWSHTPAPHTARFADGDPSEHTLWMFRADGPTREALLADLSRTPVTRTHLSDSLPLGSEQVGNTVRIWPEIPLLAGETYWVAVAAWSRSDKGAAATEPRVWSVSVPPTGAGGASLVGTWPGDEASGVSPAVGSLALAFSGPVHGYDSGVHLVNEGDGSKPGVRVDLWPCDDAGWPRAVTCLQLVPGGPLVPNSTYAVRLSAAVRDGSGAPLEGQVFRFRTGLRGQGSSLQWVSLDCFDDEVRVGDACALAQACRVRLRARVTGPATFRFERQTGDGRAAAFRSHDGDFVRWFEDFDGHFRGLLGTLKARGTDGATVSNRVRVSLVEDLPELYITEVMHNPLGPEPEQEFVEVFNGGDESLNLLGFALSDGEDHGGDVVDQPIFVSPGARVLWVPNGYDRAEGSDPGPPPGIMLVRAGSSLGRSGLRNGGEALVLRDGEGRRLSATPRAAAGAGKCLHRSATDLSHGCSWGRSGEPGAFVSGPCTPGRGPGGTVSEP